MAESAPEWRPIVKRRATTLGLVLLVWALAIAGRLYNLQVQQHEAMVKLAASQQNDAVPAPAARGEIRDRQGRVLAYSVDADTIYAVPPDVDDAAAAVQALCQALTDCTAKERDTLRQRLTSARKFQYVRRRVSPDQARRVAELGLDGIGFMRESRRFYPNRELAAHVVGYVGLDNVGLGGLEATYDKAVRGRAGQLIVQADGRGRPFGRLGRIPTSGGSLELTIDEPIQHIVERELKRGVEEKRADGGAVVVMDPRTGEILALASYPTFNPNAFSQAPAAARRNRAVQDLYEPGSTFKVVTIAAALEEGAFPLDALIDTSPGVIRFGSRVIDEFEGHNYGVLSFTDVIVKSSNVGAIKIGLKLGPERLGLYAKRFGFGVPTSPDFPGESPGILWNPARLDDSALASMSMGYQVGVTPLQMTAAMSAVANGGTWIEPRIVRAVTLDGVRTKVEPRHVRRVIRPETAAQMTPILEAVVTNGTGKSAKVPGFTVAGKTGTADKLVEGRYSNSQQNVSFLGFAPSRAPRLAVIVMVDTPRVGSDTGGAVAAPIFSRITDATLRYLGVPPTVNPAPPVMLASREPAPVTLIRQVTPLPPRVEPAGTSPIAVIPDLTRLSARQALQTLARLGLHARLHGSGVVIDQTPKPGDPVERGATCTLVLARDPRRPLGTGASQ